MGDASRTLQEGHIGFRMSKDKATRAKNQERIRWYGLTSKDKRTELKEYLNRELKDEVFTINSPNGEVKVKYVPSASGELNTSVGNLAKNHHITLTPKDVVGIIRSASGGFSRHKEYVKGEEHLKKKRGVLKTIHSFEYVKVTYKGKNYILNIANTKSVSTPYYISKG